MDVFTHETGEPSDDRTLAQRWEEDGYLLLRGFFDPSRVSRINDLIDRLWDERGRTNSSLVIDTDLNTTQHRRLLFSDAPGAARTSPHKINDLYLEYEEIRQVVLDQELTRIVGQLLQGTPLVINTLNFEFGSQQHDHVDTFYMPPRKQNCMLATWIALEPVTIDAGPIRYYPRSHKIPPYLFSHGKTNAIAAELPGFYDYMAQEMATRQIEPETFTADAGDLFIWHAQLLHGGTPIQDPLKTRRSLVTHYFRKSEYRHVFWRIKKVHSTGYFYKRPHQAQN